MTAREAVALLVADGWIHVRTSGSHMIFKHPNKPGLIIVPQHGSKDLGKGLVKAILKQAGLEI